MALCLIILCLSALIQMCCTGLLIQGMVLYHICGITFPDILIFPMLSTAALPLVIYPITCRPLPEEEQEILYKKMQELGAVPDGRQASELKKYSLAGEFSGSVAGLILSKEKPVRFIICHFFYYYRHCGKPCQLCCFPAPVP